MLYRCNSIQGGEDKVYLAPIIDGYNAEIIAYNISFSPNMEQQHEMLSQLQDKDTMV